MHLEMTDLTTNELTDRELFAAKVEINTCSFAVEADTYKIFVKLTASEDDFFHKKEGQFKVYNWPPDHGAWTIASAMVALRFYDFLEHIE